MKVIIELPDKYLDIAKELMLITTFDEEGDEQLLTEYVERAKVIKEPLSIDIEEEFKKGEDGKKFRQFYVGLAAIAIGQVGRNLEKDKEKEQ